MLRVHVGLLAFVTACWTSGSSGSSSELVRNEASSVRPSPSEHFEGTLQIDDAAGHKGFQGVWLQRRGGGRLVLDYRARELWRSFEDHAVRITGRCYIPHGQAIMATHFRVDELRFIRPPDVSTRFLAIGPEVLLRGTFVEHTWPAGTKLAGTTKLQFRAASTTYAIAGSNHPVRATDGTAAAVRARSVTVDRSHVATGSEDHLWILAVEDTASAPQLVPCPSE